ncbi:alpha/beta fold hydrolase [Croceicoccus mobilis]|uniref:AB hydrolase-1 domain-containing protein n=1 Tax=Croceicoccus mobilis TaxID=1703339 RepID=A0A916Z7J8_9SPHN|nr:alpha/beta hydrolase [Croceicoccus mobilis]GGD78300.1 hypothetical protein GCM10010990_30170 [Croceicoccus mobilis]
MSHPVLFVHGALGDARTWSPVIDALQCCMPAGIDARAITLSCFGKRDGSGEFTTARHALDIEEFAEALMEPPVTVVAWSYGTHPALCAALRRPDLFAGLFLYEPAFATWVDDDDARAAYRADAGDLYGPVREALECGDEEAAAIALFDGTGAPGFIPALRPDRQRIAFDNAHTLRLMMGEGTPPAKITAAEVADLTMPLTVAMGEATRPAFAVPARGLAQAVRTARLEVARNAGHMLPEEDPARLAAMVAKWLTQEL